MIIPSCPDICFIILTLYVLHLPFLSPRRSSDLRGEDARPRPARAAGSRAQPAAAPSASAGRGMGQAHGAVGRSRHLPRVLATRSEEHTSELQSPCNLVCRLRLEK